MIVQTVIAITGILSIVATAANRVLLGLVIALVGIPFWLYVAATYELWGVFAVMCVYAIVYLTGVFLRLRRPKPQVDDEEDFPLGI